MRFSHRLALAILPALLLTAAARPQEATVDPVIGVWRNPHGTIDVRTEPCGADLCGVIVRASPAAEADAKEAGVTQLIGLQLLEHYSRMEHNRWVGRVYVPDMGQHFSSRIQEIDANSLKISGCLIGGWLCKSQIWTRV